MLMYAILLALFLPLGTLLSSVERRNEELDNANLQSMVYYVDQLRAALPIYRAAHHTAGSGVQLIDFKNLPLPPSLSEDKERTIVKQYVDDQGFYMVWEKPPSGLANALVQHYSRATEQKLAQPAMRLIFYHIGFAKLQGSQIYLETSRYYSDPKITPNSWPLPIEIQEGSLVLTDRKPNA